MNGLLENSGGGECGKTQAVICIYQSSIFDRSFVNSCRCSRKAEEIKQILC